MSAVVEDLIVAMGFDNRQFEAAVQVSLATLSTLKSNLKFDGKKNGIDDVQASVNNFSTAGMNGQIDGVSAKFLAMSTIAITALSNIVNKAVDAGIQVAKSFTIAPVSEGFAEYETKMGSIQTILANTSADGTTLQEVTANLDELNSYADQTIYNFGDMTRNIGLFTNAGIGVESATKMIKGFSNEAAASGTSAEKAAGAAYQLSQGLSTGVITAQDWISLTSAGMGNSNMKDGIIQIAEAMGAFEGTTITAADAQKDFKGSLEKKWLSADVMEQYLNIQAEGEAEVNREVLKGLGLTDEQTQRFIDQQKIAQESATKVRTFTQLMGTLKEGVGSSWAQTFDIVVGDFDQATELFSGVSDTLSGLIGKVGEARNQLLKGWADGGGRADLIEGLGNAFKGLMSVLTPIKDAFRQIFPPTTVASLLSMTEGFKNFTAGLIVGSETAERLKRTFAGVFAIFGIGWEVVKGIFSLFGQLFGAVQGGSGGFLSLTATIGDFLVKVHEAIKGGEVFKNIFSVIGTVLAAPISLISKFANSVGEMVGGLGDATGTLKQFFDILFNGEYTSGPLAEDSTIVRTLTTIHDGLSNVSSMLSQFWNALAKGQFVSGFFEEDSPVIQFLLNVREAISDFFSSDAIQILLTGAGFAGLGIAIKKSLQKAFKFGSEDSESFFGTIKGAFASARDTFDGVSDILDKVTGSFKAMQQSLQATTLLKIGAAIGIVALSIKLLSTIEIGDLAKSLGGVAIAMGLLMAGLTLMTKLSASGALSTIPSLAASLVLLSTAILILSAAVKSLSSLSWEELAKGLGGLAVLLALIVATAYGLGKSEGMLVRTGLALIPFAAAVKILASAVKDMASLSWGEMLKGLTGLGAVMLGVAGAMKLMPKDTAAMGAGMVAIAIAMKIFASAIGQLGGMDLLDMVQGLAGIGAAMLIIAGALKLMPADMPGMAAGLLLVSIALVGISASVIALGGMSWEDLAKGLIGLGGSLLILAGALTLMSGTLAGSAALGVAAISLALLLPSILALSMLSWEQLLIGMAGLAGTLGILGVSGLLLGPVVPILMGLGVALALIGAGMVGFGFGLTLFSGGLTALIGVLNLGAAAFQQLLDAIPRLSAAFALGVVSFATSLASKGAELAEAGKKLTLALLQAFIDVVPKIAEAGTAIFRAFLQIIIDNVGPISEAVKALILAFLNVVQGTAPQIIETIFSIMMSFLQTIRDRVPEIVTVVTDIIVAFIGALQDNLPRVIQAGFDFIIGFLNGLADAIRENTPLVIDAAFNVGTAIIEGIIEGIGQGLGRVIESAKGIASSALNAAKGVLGIASPSKEFNKIGVFVTKGLVNGIDRGREHVAAAGRNLAGNLLGSVNKELDKLGGTAKTVFDILAFGEYTENGGIFDVDSPVVERMIEIRKGLFDINGAASEFNNIMLEGDFKGTGPWEEDSSIVDTLFDVREGMIGVAVEAGKAMGVLTSGDNRGFVIWNQDSPIVRTLADIHAGMVDVGGAAKEAWNILSEGDFKGKGPWEEDSPIVDTLFDIREGFEAFRTVGDNAIQGLINGFQSGTSAVAQAAQEMVNQALIAARATLGIASPSKKFQLIGQYTVEGLIMGLKGGEEKVNGQAKTLANGLINGFSKGIGKEMPKIVSSIFETLKTGTADAQFWGPNNPATIQLQNMSKALKEVDLQLAAFYGEVNLADPASIEAYAEKTGESLKYLLGLLNGLEKATNQAFDMLASGKGLDVVLGNEDLLMGLFDAVVSVLPGIYGSLIKVGLAVIDGFLGIFFKTSVMKIIGDFITFAVRQIGALFGIEFPVEEELDDANKELEDFLVNVEDTQGRFEKLTEAGIKALTNTLTEANDAVDDLGDQAPTITPILDLTEYNKAKGGMEADIAPSVAPTASAEQASAIYDDRRSYEANQAASGKTPGSTTLNFTQNNTSPEPLGHVEIYKQTKSQLAVAKEALGVS